VYNTLSLVASLVMRTSPCWICTCHILLHATSRLQLSYHVWFGFSRHPCTVSAISPLSDIETRHIRMCWKGDNNIIILVLVQASEGSWFMLCDHNNVLHHFLLGQLRFVSSRAFSPSCGRPRSPPTLGCSLSHKTQSPPSFRVVFCLLSCDFRRGSNFHHSYYNVEFFCCDSGPLFLFITTVLISPFVIRTWTPLSLLQFISAIIRLHTLLSCLCSWFACREKPSWRGQSGCAWLINNVAVV
jgi:hypothetical protein